MVFVGRKGDEADQSTVQDKIDNLRSGHGTILFFEDEEGEQRVLSVHMTLRLVVDGIKQRYPAYAAKFSTWSLQSAAMAQYAGTSEPSVAR